MVTSQADAPSPSRPLVAAARQGLQMAFRQSPEKKSSTLQVVYVWDAGDAVLLTPGAVELMNNYMYTRRRARGDTRRPRGQSRAGGGATRG